MFSFIRFFWSDLAQSASVNAKKPDPRSLRAIFRRKSSDIDKRKLKSLGTPVETVKTSDPVQAGVELFSGPSRTFIEEARLGRLTDQLTDAWFAQYGWKAPEAEVRAWRNSLQAMKDVLDTADLRDQGILVEYRLPGSSLRIDCMVTGLDEAGAGASAVVELKQWERTLPAEGEYVVTWVGGANRERLHPSVQATQYKRYLEDMHGAFYGEDPIHLSAYAFLHNYRLTPDDSLLDPKFESYLAEAPVIGESDRARLSRYLEERVGHGEGMGVLERIRETPHGPSKQLMDHVASTIHDHPDYVLLDDQLLAYDKVKTLAYRALRTYEKHAVIIHGGPGTGKSVLAMNLTGELLRDDLHVNYATGSKAFTQTLWKKLGTRSKPLFRYFNNYGQHTENEVDVLVMDEAHRIREKSDHFRTPRHLRTGKPQILELLEASRVSVFFLDEAQVIRPDEVGSSQLIKSHADQLGIPVHEMRLTAQFRCAGSDGFVNWVDQLLHIRQTANVLWTGDPNFRVEIVPTPEDLEAKIRAHNTKGQRARLVAGFCWPWTTQPDEDGELIHDVQIGDWTMPWNRNDMATGVRRGIPKAPLWANEPGGIDQVGCIYTAQGFEFDHVGVIWGRDLRWDPDQAEWIGDRTASKDPMMKRDPERFLEHVKNAYRILLTRGMNGCSIHFLDKETERFVRSRMST